MVDSVAAEIFDAVDLKHRPEDLELFEKTKAEQYEIQIALIKHYLYKLYMDEPAAAGLSPKLITNIIQGVLTKDDTNQ